MHLSPEARRRRVARLKSGDWSFGHGGMHKDVGTDACPYMPRHHHHDEFCKLPTIGELIDAGIDPNDFKARRRAG